MKIQYDFVFKAHVEECKVELWKKQRREILFYFSSLIVISFYSIFYQALFYTELEVHIDINVYKFYLLESKNDMKNMVSFQLYVKAEAVSLRLHFYIMLVLLEDEKERKGWMNEWVE